jgi:HAD superfamily phosphoserine phosphatase-like hydrolase
VNRVVFTDLDGTLTIRDTYVDFLLQFMTFYRLVCNILPLLKIILMYLIKKATNDDVKVVTFRAFFKDIELVNIDDKIPKFLANIKWNREVIDIVNKLKSDGCKIVIVTASPDFYVKYICDYLKFDGFISTVTKVSNSKLTGEFDGKVCNFLEKVDRINKSKYLESKPEKTLSFGNSKGDFLMLSFCDESYFVKKSSIKRFSIKQKGG